MRTPKRNQSTDFRTRLALAALKCEKTLANLAAQFDVRPNQITQWKGQLLEQASSLFDGGANGKSEKPVRFKALHPKIGELTLENCFLEAAITKASMLREKR